MTEDEIEKRVTELHAQCAAEPDMVRRYELRDQIAPLEKQLDAFRLMRTRKFLADMDARRAATAATSATTSPAAIPAASVTPSPSPPAPSAAEIAQRRRAETAAFWRKIVGRVNAEMSGSGPDSSQNASGGAPLNSGQKPKGSREVWRKAIAAANAGIAGGEPSASQERQASPDSRPQTDDFMSKAMVTARKHLADAGFSVAR